MGEKARDASVNESPNIIPIAFTLRVEENKETVKMLDYAVIAENTEVINIAHTTAAVEQAYASVKGMFSLSPTKILLTRL